MTDRGFTHPDFGKEVRVEQQGNEVRLIFSAGSLPQAESLSRSLVKQLKDGALHLTLMGKATGSTEWVE